MSYLWLKALHVAAVIAFVGGVLSASVYLATQARDVAPSPDQQRTNALVRRWDRTVTTPAMLVVWALGLTLALQGGWFTAGWLRAKLALVLALSGVHGMQSGALRRLAGGAPARPPALHVVGPVVLALVLAIAVLVVVKPF